jgi:hypothetical protein
MIIMPEIKVQEPTIINNIFDLEYFNILLTSINKFTNSEKFFDVPLKRYITSGNEIPIFKDAGEMLLPIANKIFNNNNLISYDQICTHYEGEQTKLYRHKDVVPNIYVIDVCMYQKTPWDIVIEDKAYSLKINDALCFYPGNQMHWREKFPDPKNNIVSMIQFYFAEEGHWILREKIK